MNWDEDTFCGIVRLAAPKDRFWTPDIGIVERYKITCQNFYIFT